MGGLVGSDRRDQRASRRRADETAGHENRSSAKVSVSSAHEHSMTDEIAEQPVWRAPNHCLQPTKRPAHEIGRVVA